jgi:hypothetical protein
MSVVMTWMPAGEPKNSGDSKFSIPRIKLRMVAPVSAGSISFSVTVKKVRSRVAPHIRAASSRLGSMARKASTISRNRNGTEYCIMCQTTPP